MVTALVQGSTVITASMSNGNGSATGTRTITVNPYRPTFISSNRLWLDASSTSSLYQDHTQLVPISASGQTLGAWNDLSGNNYHFTQSNGGSRPTYLQNQTSTGQACISFGASQILLSNSLLGLATGDPRTFIAVGKINNTTNARESFLSHALPGNCCQYMGFDTRTNGAAFFGIYFPSAHLDSNYPLDTNLHVFNIKILDTTVGISINPNTNVIHKIDGTTNTLTTVLGGPTIANHSGMTVTSIGGGTGTGWGGSLDGLVCELMVFKEPLTQTEENYIHSYLKTKWGTP